MSEITQDKYSPGYWGLDGRVLGFNDWIEMKHENKWMLVDVPDSDLRAIHRKLQRIRAGRV